MTEQDLDEKLSEPPKTKAKKPKTAASTASTASRVTIAQLKSMANTRWAYHTPIVLRYLRGEQDKYVPRAVQRFGKENFEERNNRLYLFGREVVVSEKRKREILNKEEGRYGGVMKAMSRIQAKFVNISRKELSEFFGGSERRQLKARYQKTKELETYIHARTPGTLQCDLTFYKNQRYPVFGAIDVFSRWCYYKRVPDKKAASVVEILKDCRREFEKVSNHKLKKISTDSGVEFRQVFAAYLKREKITNDRQVKSRKLIEALNRGLRFYVERIGWDDTYDLDEIIEGFVTDYNDTKHSATNKTPNELVSIKKTAIQNILNKVAGRMRIKDGPGFKMAKLAVGDTVRVYDPRRREVKAKQKAKLKGKIKLNASDYVKQYTSFHRGIAPHWSLKVYKVTKIIDGEKRTLFKLEDRKGVFVRSELQKVREVTKKDPRRKTQKQIKPAARQVVVPVPVTPEEKHLAKVMNAEPSRPKSLAITKSSFLGKQIILWYITEPKPRLKDPATVIGVYRTCPIVWHESGELAWSFDYEFVKFTGKTSPEDELQQYIWDQEEWLKTARKEIDEEL